METKLTSWRERAEEVRVFRVHLPGRGGHGSKTANRFLGTGAFLSGRHALGLYRNAQRVPFRTLLLSCAGAESTCWPFGPATAWHFQRFAAQGGLPHTSGMEVDSPTSILKSRREVAAVREGRPGRSTPTR